MSLVNTYVKKGKEQDGEQEWRKMHTGGLYPTQEGQSEGDWRLQSGDRGKSSQVA